MNVETEKPAVDRAPIGALQSEETFLRFAQHLKALHLRLADRERSHKAVCSGLLKQIQVFEDQCAELAHGNPRCAEMWTEVKRELAPMRCVNRP